MKTEVSGKCIEPTGYRTMKIKYKAK